MYVLFTNLFRAEFTRVQKYTYNVLLILFHIFEIAFMKVLSVEIKIGNYIEYNFN